MQLLLSMGICQGWNGIVFRYTSSKYAGAAKLMSGEGAFRAGGRWNSPGSFHAVYCASNPELANREFFAGTRSAGIPLHKVLPLTGKAVQVSLARVIDLRDPTVLKTLATSVDALRDDPWRKLTDSRRESLCQAVGRSAFEAGLQAMIVPSASAEGPLDFNLVLIIENAPKGSGHWKILRRTR